MKLVDLHDQIMKNCLTNFYVFTGNEIGIMNVYLQHMSESLNLPIKRVDSVSQIYNRCTVKSMFGDENRLYVIRDDTDFTKHESVYSTIKHDIGKNAIVLLYDTIDSRLKFSKFFKDSTVEFERMSERVLVKYVYQQLPDIDSTYAEALVKQCDCRYDVCMSECDKIKQLAEYTKCKLNVAYGELLNEQQLPESTDTDVFKFVDSLCSNRIKIAVQTLYKLTEHGVNSIAILGTLYSGMKAIMLIGACDCNDIARTTGLSSQQIYYNQKYTSHITPDKGVYNLRLIEQTIEDIKAGKIADEYAVKYVIVNMKL